MKMFLPKQNRCVHINGVSRVGKSRIRLARVLASDIVAPPSFDGSKNVPWQMDDNDKYGCCVMAMIYHFLQNQGFLQKGWPLPDDAAAVLANYLKLSPQDQGLPIDHTFQWLCDSGFVCSDGSIKKATTFADVDKSNLDHMKIACALMGGGGLTVKLKQSDMDNFDAGRTWDKQRFDTFRRTIGGHQVYHVGYDGRGNNWLVTWGKVQVATDAWILNRITGYQAVVAAQLPGGVLDLNALRADLNAAKA